MKKPWDNEVLLRNRPGCDLLTAEERAGTEDPEILRLRAFTRWKRLEHALQDFASNLRRFTSRDH